MTTLDTAREIIDAVGGTGAFASWWFGNDPLPPVLRCKRVSHWKVRGFPRGTFLVMSTRLLRQKKINASPAAWGMEILCPASRAA